MRTTLNIDSEVMRRAKRRATEEGVSLHELVEHALRSYLDASPHRSGYRLRWRTERGRLMPGIDLDSRRSLLDRMNGLD